MRSSAVWEDAGAMYAWQKYGVKPDIMTTAKALGCGVPVGAFLMTEKVAAAFPDKRRSRNDLRWKSACVQQPLMWYLIYSGRTI